MTDTYDLTEYVETGRCTLQAVPQRAKWVRQGDEHYRTFNRVPEPPPRPRSPMDCECAICQGLLLPEPIR